MGSSTYDRLPVTEDVILHPFGQTQEVHPSGQSDLDLRVTPAEGIPDDDHVRIPVEILRPIPLVDLYAKVFDHFGSRRIEGPIRSPDFPSSLKGEAGPGDHGRSSDPAEVDGWLPLLVFVWALAQRNLGFKESRVRQKSAEPLEN